MILPDVNVLICAFRGDLPQRAVCRAWLAGVVMTDARFGLSPLVLGAVVRVNTNPRVYRTPSTIEKAFGYCENLRGQPHCQIVEPGEQHWDLQATLHRDGNGEIDVANRWVAPAPAT